MAVRGLLLAAASRGYYLVAVCWLLMLDFPGGSDGKESTRNAGDLGLIPGLGRSPEQSMTTHSSVLAWRIPWTRGAWQATAHEVEKELDMT